MSSGSYRSLHLRQSLSPAEVSVALSGSLWRELSLPSAPWVVSWCGSRHKCNICLLPLKKPLLLMHSPCAFLLLYQSSLQKSLTKIKSNLQIHFTFFTRTSSCFHYSEENLWGFRWLKTQNLSCDLQVQYYFLLQYLFPFQQFTASVLLGVGCEFWVDLLVFIFLMIVMFFACKVRMASWIFAWVEAKGLKSCPVSFNELQTAWVLLDFESKSDICSAEFQMGLWNCSLQCNSTGRACCSLLLRLCPCLASSAGGAELFLSGNCRIKQGIAGCAHPSKVSECR